MIQSLVRALVSHDIPYTWMDGALVFTIGNRAYTVTPTSGESLLIARGDLKGR